MMGSSGYRSQGPRYQGSEEPKDGGVRQSLGSNIDAGQPAEQ